MHKLKSLALVGVLTVVGAVTAHAQNLIANGDFTANAALFNEQTGLPSTGYCTNPNVLSGNPAGITGWDLQYVTQGWAYYGLNGAATALGTPNQWGPSNPGGLTYMFLYPGPYGVASQVLSLAANTDYQLDFDVAQTATSAAFSWGASIVDGATTYYSGTAVANNAAFNHVTATFTTLGSVGAPTISLMNMDGDYTHAIDFANVSLVAVVPEPTTAALAGLGIVLAGAGRWLRRRSA